MGPKLWSPPRISLSRSASHFIHYLLEISTAHHSGTKYYFWADDSQLYLIFESWEAGATNDNMESLIKDKVKGLLLTLCVRIYSKTELSILCSTHLSVIPSELEMKSSQHQIL